MSELLPTQEVEESQPPIQDTQEETKCWGRLLPLKHKLPSLDLVDECYMFGRGDGCNYVFTLQMFEDQEQLSTFSKNHFKIMLESTNHGTIAFIHDLSSNGTFLNGDKIGKGKRRPLNNNDEISLSTRKNKCFIFSDSNSIQKKFPLEVTQSYTVCKVLGRGACGEVRLVFGKSSCEKLAMKIVKKKNFSVASKLGCVFAHRIQSEVDILMKLSHPCIICIHDVIDTNDALYMILELVEGGELYDRIVAYGHLSESDAKFLFMQMIMAVKYLHEHGITHRDLKPENILLTSNENRCLIKVTDFGLSKLVDGNTMLRTFCGTPTYLAPEVLKTAGAGTYTPAIDIWSLGVILFVCLGGYPPFTEERTDCDLQTQITGGLYDFPDQFWGAISSEAKDLIRRMLTVDPNKRITIQGVLDHPWLANDPLLDEVQVLLGQRLNQSDAPVNDSVQSATVTVENTTITPTTDVQNALDPVNENKSPIGLTASARKRPATEPGGLLPCKQCIT